MATSELTSVTEAVALNTLEVVRREPILPVAVVSEGAAGSTSSAPGSVVAVVVAVRVVAASVNARTPLTGFRQGITRVRALIGFGTARSIGAAFRARARKVLRRRSPYAHGVCMDARSTSGALDP